MLDPLLTQASLLQGIFKLAISIHPEVQSISTRAEDVCWEDGLFASVLHGTCGLL